MLETGRALIMRDGRVVVMDQIAGVLRVFDVGGEETARLGGPGAGSGEFSRFSTLAIWTGDTIAVHDFPNARISPFTYGRCPPASGAALRSA